MNRKKMLSVLCTVLLFCGCTERNTPADPVEDKTNATQTDIIVSENEQTESGAETYAGTADNSPQTDDPMTDTESTVSENEQTERGEDFYVSVTDCEGTDKYLFYLAGDEENKAVTYLEETSYPDEMIGYISVMSQDRPAKKGEVFFGSRLAGFIEENGLVSADIRYMVGNSTSKGMTLSSEEEPTEYNELARLMDFEPDLSADIDFVSSAQLPFEQRYPLISLDFSADSWDITTPTNVHLLFSVYKKKPIAKLYIEDYTALEEIEAAADIPTPEELKAAYYESTECESDWFYLDEGTALYDYALRCVIRKPENGLVRSAPEKENEGYFSRDGFSEELTEVFGERTVPEGYKTVNACETYFSLPEDGTVFKQEYRAFMWSGKAGGGTVIFKIGNTAWIDDDNMTFSCEGTFNGRPCRYAVYSDPVTGSRYDQLTFYTAEFKITAEMRTDAETGGKDEYDMFVRTVYGSFSAFPEENAEETPVNLAEKPSEYPDIAYGYCEDMYTDDREKVSGEFFLIDFYEDYETTRECFLEKKEEGGWYRVEPSKETYLSENNTSERFYNVFEDEQVFGEIDLSSYPPLPTGHYRIVMPFKRVSDGAEYAVWGEFTMNDPIKPAE